MKKLHKVMMSNKSPYLKKTRWLAIVLIQELLMLKFRAIFKYFVKPTYRKDINRICSVMSKHEWYSELTELDIQDIHPSHEINYPEWVLEIINRLMIGTASVKPIKVIEIDDRFMVIDGNHRLMAYRFWFGFPYKIQVRLLKPKK